MFFYHFLQLCPRGHISKMLAVTVIKNTATKRLWNFQIHFLPYSNAFEEKFFSSNMFFYHFLQLCPRGHISKMLAVTVIKNTATKRLWNFQIHFLPYSKALSSRVINNGYSKHFRDMTSGTKLKKMIKEHVWKKNFSSNAFE